MSTKRIILSVALVVATSVGTAMAAEKMKIAVPLRAPVEATKPPAGAPPVGGGDLCSDPAVVSLETTTKKVQNGEGVFLLSGKVCNNGTADYDNANDPIAFRFSYNVFSYPKRAPVATQAFTAAKYPKLAKGQCVKVDYTLKVPKISSMGVSTANQNVTVGVEAFVTNGTDVPSNESFANNRKKNCKSTNDRQSLAEIPAVMTQSTPTPAPAPAGATPAK